MGTIRVAPGMSAGPFPFMLSVVGGPAPDDADKTSPFFLSTDVPWLPVTSQGTVTQDLDGDGNLDAPVDYWRRNMLVMEALHDEIVRFGYAPAITEDVINYLSRRIVRVYDDGALYVTPPGGLKVYRNPCILLSLTPRQRLRKTGKASMGKNNLFGPALSGRMAPWVYHRAGF